MVLAELLVVAIAHDGVDDASTRAIHLVNAGHYFD